MADLTITASSVLAGEGAQTETGTAGAAVTAGQAVYLDGTDDRYKLSDSNSATVAARSVRGIALHAAAIGQPLTIHRSGPLTIGATLTANGAYCLSDTPGGICPAADVGSGEYMVQIGLATSTTVLNVRPIETGVAS